MYSNSDASWEYIVFGKVVLQENALNVFIFPQCISYK